MGFPERQLKGMHPVRVLVEQIAQVRCGTVRGCDGQQHEPGLYGGRIRRSLQHGETVHVPVLLALQDGVSSSHRISRGPNVMRADYMCAFQDQSSLNGERPVEALPKRGIAPTIS